MSESEMLKFGIQEFFVKMFAGDALPDLSRVAEHWRPDLIVRESAEMAAPVVAAKTSTHHVRVEVHDSPAERIFFLHGTAQLDELRRSVGLPSDGGLSLKTEPASTSFPNSFHAKSDWRDRVKPLRVNTQADAVKPSLPRPAWEPDNGLPLVYLTFGTVAGNESKERDAYQTAIKAVGSLPISVLLTTGNNMDRALLLDIPANVYVETWVPQDDVFSYASAIVHHCGSGTLIGALAAGLPCIVVPIFADQPANATQLETLGAGVAVFDLNAQSLQRAFMRVLDDDSFRAVSEKIACEISAMPNIDIAVEEMTSFVMGE